MAGSTLVGCGQTPAAPSGTPKALRATKASEPSNAPPRATTTPALPTQVIVTCDIGGQGQLDIGVFNATSGKYLYGASGTYDATTNDFGSGPPIWNGPECNRSIFNNNFTEVIDTSGAGYCRLVAHNGNLDCGSFGWSRPNPQTLPTLGAFGSPTTMTYWNGSVFSEPSGTLYELVSTIPYNEANLEGNYNYAEENVAAVPVMPRSLTLYWPGHEQRVAIADIDAAVRSEEGAFGTENWLLPNGPTNVSGVGLISLTIGNTGNPLIAVGTQYFTTRGTPYTGSLVLPGTKILSYDPLTGGMSPPGSAPGAPRMPEANFQVGQVVENAASTSAAFVGSGGVLPGSELFTVPITGGTPKRIATPDGSDVLYYGPLP